MLGARRTDGPSVDLKARPSVETAVNRFGNFSFGVLELRDVEAALLELMGALALALVYDLTVE